jgi:hypothetical protein
MQKIFSTRLEEATIDELNRTARRLRVSKRQFIEDAIQTRIRQVQHSAAGDDVWAETLGAWQRPEGAATTIRRARRAFTNSMARHHRSAHARVRR